MSVLTAKEPHKLPNVYSLRDVWEGSNKSFCFYSQPSHPPHKISARHVPTPGSNDDGSVGIQIGCLCPCAMSLLFRLTSIHSFTQSLCFYGAFRHLLWGWLWVGASRREHSMNEMNADNPDLAFTATIVGGGEAIHKRVESISGLRACQTFS